MLQGIIKCPINGLFHKRRDVIITFGTNFYEVVDVHDDNAMRLESQK